MSYVAATLVDQVLGRFICGLYPEYITGTLQPGQKLGIVIRDDLDKALDGVSLIGMLLQTHTAEVTVDTEALSSYIERTTELLTKLTQLGESCEKRLQEEIEELAAEEEELQEVIDECDCDECDFLDKEAVDEILHCHCPVCEGYDENI